MRKLLAVVVISASAMLAQAAAPYQPADPLSPFFIARLGHARMVVKTPASALHVSPDGLSVICGERCFDLKTGKERSIPVKLPADHAFHCFLGGSVYVTRDDDESTVHDVAHRTIRFAVERKFGDRVTFDRRGRFCLHVGTGKEDEKVVRLADLQQGNRDQPWKTLATLADSPPPCLAPDGGRVVWWDAPRSRPAVYAVSSGKVTHLVPEKVAGRRLWAFAFSPDAKTIACAFDDFLLSFDSSGKEIDRKRLSRRWYGGEAFFTPDGRHVVLASEGGYHLVPTTGAKGAAFFHIGEDLSSLVRTWTLFAPFADSKRLAMRDGHGVIRVVDLETGRQLDEHSRFPPIAGVQVLGGDRAASWTTGGRLVIWDMRSGRVLSEATIRVGEEVRIAEVRFSPTGKHVASRRADGRGLLADASTGKVITEMSGRILLSTSFSPRGERVAFLTVADEDRSKSEATLFSVPEGKVDRKITLPPVERISLSPDGRGLICAPSYGVSWHELASGKARWSNYLPLVRVIRESSNTLCLMEWCRSGIVFVRRYDIAVLDPSTGERKLYVHRTEDQHGSGPMPAAVSASGRVLAIREDQSNSLTFYDLGAKHPNLSQRKWYCPGSSVTSLAVDDDGGRLVTGHADGTCVVWDLRQIMAPSVPPRVDDPWDLLADLDPEIAQPAIVSLQRQGPKAVKLLAEKLKPAVEVPPKRIASWVADLDAEEFDRRTTAEARLLAARDQAEPALRRAVDKPLSLEQHRRAERLLTRVDPANDPELLRQIRAVEILEHIGTKEAVALLQKLAKGAPAARLTREAKESLTRLKRRDDS